MSFCRLKFAAYLLENFDEECEWVRNYVLLANVNALFDANIFIKRLLLFKKTPPFAFFIAILEFTAHTNQPSHPLPSISPSQVELLMKHGGRVKIPWNIFDNIAIYVRLTS